MKIRAIAAAAATVLALSACGGDDDGGGGSAQSQVADMMIDALNESFSQEGVEGIELDEDCVRDAVAELSDDDAQKILDAGPDDEPEGLSEEAEGAAEQLTECFSFDIG